MMAAGRACIDVQSYVDHLPVDTSSRLHFCKHSFAAEDSVGSECCITGCQISAPVAVETTKSLAILPSWQSNILLLHDVVQLRLDQSLTSAATNHNKHVVVVMSQPCTCLKSLTAVTI